MPFVVVVGNDSLGVEQGQQLACLPVYGGVVGVLAPEHQLTGKVPGDEELRPRVAMFQDRCAAPAGPRAQPVEMGADLALDVVIAVPTDFDDEP